MAVESGYSGSETVKTYSMKQGEIAKDWVLLDAADVPLGRLATRVATILRGKDKPSFTPHLDMGDNVIIVNAAKVKLTGQKLDKKVYLHHTGYMGGQRETSLKKLMASRPDDVIKRAVKGMLPKNKLGRQLMANLRVYPGADHPHGPQQPKVLDQ